MADAEVQIAPDGTGKQIDACTVTTGSGTVYRQRVALGDNSTGAAVVDVDNVPPAATEYGLVTRPLLLNFVKTVNANPTAVVLAASQTFTQAASIDLGDMSSGGASYSRWRCLVSADSGGTLNMQQSPDGIAWSTTVTSTVLASSATVQESLIVMRFLRVQYINGAAGGSAAFLFRVILVAV